MTFKLIKIRKILKIKKKKPYKQIQEIKMSLRLFSNGDGRYETSNSNLKARRTQAHARTISAVRCFGQRVLSLRNQMKLEKSII